MISYIVIATIGVAAGYVAGLLVGKKNPAVADKTLAAVNKVQK